MITPHTSRRLALGSILGGSISAGAVLGGAVVASAPASAQTSAGSSVTVATRRRIDRDTNIADMLAIGSDGGFDIARGVTLRVTGDLTAGAHQIFFGEGRVDLNASRVLCVRAEWWGARPDDAGYDSEPALRAALAAHLAVQLGQGDYFCGRTLVVDRHNARLWGVGRSYGARGTRLVVIGSRATVLFVGAEQAPRSVGDFIRGVDIRALELGRSLPADPPSDPASGAGVPTGLRARHVVNCVFETLRANEHGVGFAIHGAVRSAFIDCTASRALPSKQPEDDVFIGFDAAGFTEPFPGANASVYLIDCVATVGNALRLKASIGLRLVEGVADTFVTRFETSAIAQGIVVDGRRAALDAGRRRAAHANVHIVSPVLDGCIDGIVLRNLSEHALIDVSDCYVALSAAGRSAISVTECGGNISIAQGQLIGWPAVLARRDVAGIEVRGATGLAVSGTKLLSFTRPVDAERMTGFDLVVAINGQTGVSPSAAVTLKNCGGGYLRPAVQGVAGSYDGGVAVVAAVGPTTVDTGAIDARVVRGRVVTADGSPAAVVQGRAIV